jgi:hypothetical protein
VLVTFGVKEFLYANAWANDSMSASTFWSATGWNVFETIVMGGGGSASSQVPKSYWGSSAGHYLFQSFGQSPGIFCAFGCPTH